MMPRWPFARKPTTAAAPKPQTGPTGGSGRWHTDGFLQYEELNVELRHPQGCQVYDRMWRGFPDIRRAWGMWCNPIIAGTWQIEPDGGDDADDQARADAEFAQWALMEHLRGGLHGHLGEALGTLRHGFAPFEDVWHSFDYDGEQVLVPEYLGLRLPRSIERFVQNDREELDWIEQLVLDQGMVKLYARDLVYYRIGAEGDNWEGVSPLRPVYRNYFMLDGIEKLDGVAQERHAVGITVVYPPKQVDRGILDETEEAVAGLRGGETAHIVMPGPHADNSEAGEGWRLDIMGMGGEKGGRDAQPSLKYHTDKIAAGLIAEFMRLGQAGEGARATADVQQDPFYVAVEGFTSTIIEPPLQKLVEKIIRVNRGERDGYPKIVMSMVDSTSMTELADYVQKLSSAGVLGADDPLEDYLREKADLPPADPEARKMRKEQAEMAAEGAKAKMEAETEAIGAKAETAAAGDGPPGPSPAKPTPGGKTAAARYAFDPNQPRDAEGQWSDGIGVGDRLHFAQGTDYKTGKALTEFRGVVVQKTSDGRLMVNAGTKKRPRWAETHVEHASRPQRAKAAPSDSKRTYRDRLTDREASAAQWYMEEGYKTINKTLRNGQEPGSATKTRIEALDSAIAKGVLEKPTTLYRAAVLGDPAGLVGKTMTDHGFVSTSEDTSLPLKMVSSKRGGVFVRIKAPKGTHAGYFHKVNDQQATSKYDGVKEREVLLPRGSAFTITGARQGSDGIWTVDAELIV